MVHIMFLPLLEDFRVIGTYSLVSTCLAWLYQDMCQASHIDAHDISNPLILLHLWAWERFPFITPLRLHLNTYDGALPQLPLSMRYVFIFNFNVYRHIYA